MFDHPLEERCYLFGKNVRQFCRNLKMDIPNIEDIKQLVRASGSVGANYIEANENVGAGDLKYRLKVARKEVKESIHFLGLIEVFNNEVLVKERTELISEAGQLRKILSAIINKIENKEK